MPPADRPDVARILTRLLGTANVPGGDALEAAWETGGREAFMDTLAALPALRARWPAYSRRRQRSALAHAVPLRVLLAHGTERADGFVSLHDDVADPLRPDTLTEALPARTVSNILLREAAETLSVDEIHTLADACRTVLRPGGRLRLIVCDAFDPLMEEGRHTAPVLADALSRVGLEVRARQMCDVSGHRMHAFWSPTNGAPGPFQHSPSVLMVDGFAPQPGGASLVSGAMAPLSLADTHIPFHELATVAAPALAGEYCPALGCAAYVHPAPAEGQVGPETVGTLATLLSSGAAVTIAADTLTKAGEATLHRLFAVTLEGAVWRGVRR